MEALAWFAALGIDGGAAILNAVWWVRVWTESFPRWDQ